MNTSTLQKRFRSEFSNMAEIIYMCRNLLLKVCKTDFFNVT